PSVRVNTIRKPDVRTRVGREDRTGRVFKKLGGGGGILRVRPVRVADVPEQGKAVGGIARRPTAVGRFRGTVHNLLPPDMAGACCATVAQGGTLADRWWSACEDMPLAKVYKSLFSLKTFELPRQLHFQTITTMMSISRTNRPSSKFSRAHHGGLR